METLVSQYDLNQMSIKGELDREIKSDFFKTIT